MQDSGEEKRFTSKQNDRYKVKCVLDNAGLPTVENIEVDIEKTTTVKTLKGRLELQLGIPSDLFNLELGDATLSDSLPLTELQIHENSIITLKLCPWWERFIASCVKSENAQIRARIRIKMQETSREDRLFVASFIAARKSNSKLLFSILAEKTLDIERTVCLSGRNLLHAAVASECSSCVADILMNGGGVLIDKADVYGESPITMAEKIDSSGNLMNMLNAYRMIRARSSSIANETCGYDSLDCMFLGKSDDKSVDIASDTLQSYSSHEKSIHKDRDTILQGTETCTSEQCSTEDKHPKFRKPGKSSQDVPLHADQIADSRFVQKEGQEINNNSLEPELPAALSSDDGVQLNEAVPKVGKRLEDNENKTLNRTVSREKIKIEEDGSKGKNGSIELNHLSKREVEEQDKFSKNIDFLDISNCAVKNKDLQMSEKRVSELSSGSVRVPGRANNYADKNVSNKTANSLGQISTHLKNNITSETREKNLSTYDSYRVWPADEIILTSFEDISKIDDEGIGAELHSSNDNTMIDYTEDTKMCGNDEVAERLLYKERSINIHIIDCNTSQTADVVLEDAESNEVVTMVSQRSETPGVQMKRHDTTNIKHADKDETPFFDARAILFEYGSESGLDTTASENSNESPPLSEASLDLQTALKPETTLLSRRRKKSLNNALKPSSVTSGEVTFEIDQDEQQQQRDMIIEDIKPIGLANKVLYDGSPQNNEQSFPSIRKYGTYTRYMHGAGGEKEPKELYMREAQVDRGTMVPQPPKGSPSNGKVNQARRKISRGSAVKDREHTVEPKLFIITKASRLLYVDGSWRRESIPDPEHRSLHSYSRRPRSYSTPLAPNPSALYTSKHTRSRLSSDASSEEDWETTGYSSGDNNYSYHDDLGKNSNNNNLSPRVRRKSEGSQARKTNRKPISFNEWLADKNRERSSFSSSSDDKGSSTGLLPRKPSKTITFEQWLTQKARDPNLRKTSHPGCSQTCELEEPRSQASKAFLKWLHKKDEEDLEREKKLLDAAMARSVTCKEARKRREEELQRLLLKIKDYETRRRSLQI